MAKRAKEKVVYEDLWCVVDEDGKRWGNATFRSVGAARQGRRDLLDFPCAYGATLHIARVLPLNMKPKKRRKPRAN